MLFVASCSNRTKGGFQAYNCSERIEDAIEAFENRREGTAINILEEMKFQCGGTDLMDSVHYYLGMSHMRLNQFMDSRIEFERLRREYPFSPFAAEAHFRIGQLLYKQSNPPDRDQTETIEAIRVFNSFLNQFPSSDFADSVTVYLNKSVDKLAQKEYNNARFYRRQGKHDASLIYYNSLISKYPTTVYAQKGLIDMGEILFEMGRRSEAQEIVEKIKVSELDEELKNRVNVLIARLDSP
ncbi:outer membrane assembly lipoprotein YfiO [Chitinispirillum alkaliphilum]|nr:outer membrane assembly lipoprotein YfiO [Chitinispirillum alkaliphilum]